jgi:hypothetical protein
MLGIRCDYLLSTRPFSFTCLIAASYPGSVGLIFRRTHFERQVYVKVPVSGSVLFLNLHIVHWDTFATGAEWGSEIILEPNKSDNAMPLAAIHGEIILRCVH